MDGSNCKSIFVPPSVIRNGTMEQVYRGKTISMMGMIDFGLEKNWEVIAKDTHRGRLLLRISPSYCIIPTVTFTM
jgi:hypothetical protein